MSHKRLNSRHELVLAQNELVNLNFAYQSIVINIRISFTLFE